MARRVTDLCREYGISRKTGDKFKQRFKRAREDGLADLSRAPKVIPHRTPPELVELIVGGAEAAPDVGAQEAQGGLGASGWGESFRRRARSATILMRAGLVAEAPAAKSSPRCRQPTTLPSAHAPNDVWCIDYKGQFRLANGSYCYPLTMTDQLSRYILGCEAMAAISDEAARESCEKIFLAMGCRKAIRSDNGAPFASTGLAGADAAVSLLDAARHRARAHPPGTSPGERPTRANAPHAEGRDHAAHLGRTCSSSRSASTASSRSSIASVLTKRSE